MTEAEAAQLIVRHAIEGCERLNAFTSRVFQTRGGRIGSGMGGVIEALWGFFVNEILSSEKSASKDIELAWMYGHEYNDFACIERGSNWNPDTRKGELLRVEVKSMVASADESKAHFDRLQSDLGPTELLAVFLWDWIPVSKSDGAQSRVSPQIRDHFIGSALEVAKLRDALHLARGGSFVVEGSCPDGCAPGKCDHVGEPLNANGVRERITGPTSRRSKTVSYAANFGGLVRMLGCRTEKAHQVLLGYSKRGDDASTYIKFVATNFTRVRKALSP